jgi:hypothetical protein
MFKELSLNEKQNERDFSMKLTMVAEESTPEEGSVKQIHPLNVTYTVKADGDSGNLGTSVDGSRKRKSTGEEVGNDSLKVEVSMSGGDGSFKLMSIDWNKVTEQRLQEEMKPRQLRFFEDF